MTIEHLTPIVRKGRNVIGNLAPACLKCNLRKKHKSAEEWVGAERAAEIRRKATLECEPIAA
jgi:5-methylcytosine-specific restriction endonuclease McrA